MTGEVGDIYTLHLDRPFGHARHYTGWARNLTRRLDHHRKGSGANMLAHAIKAGIGFEVASVERGTRDRERQLKRRGGAARRCPICKAQSD